MSLRDADWGKEKRKEMEEKCWNELCYGPAKARMTAGAIEIELKLK